MNKFLEKIAQMISKDLPYRKRVEVVIVKDGKVLLTKNKDKTTGDEWFGFPGGGLDGKSAKETCIEECLEEVGVAVKNPTSLGIKHRQEGMSTKDNRHLKFRGSDTEWFMAEYDKMDRSQLGDDGDSRQYRWEGLKTALEAVSKSKVMATPRQRALKALRTFKSVSVNED